MENLSPRLKKLLDQAIERKASDLHLKAGLPPYLRIDGALVICPGEGACKEEEVSKIIFSILGSQERIDLLKQKKELDLSFGYKEYRFRTNLFYQMGTLAVALRLIPNKIRNFSELGLPPILERFCAPSQGFFIITGPAGHGKSTTLAAMVDYINRNRRHHIITIEDPIEYLFTSQKSIISQRELGSDTNSFARALRAALREDPNVVLVGEMRDLETIDAALTLAETGHLILTTLHTASAAQAADRIIDVFPPHQQQQVRQQLAGNILGVVSQRLIPKTTGGRIAACEIMIATPAVRNTIREGKTHQLSNIIATSATEGMISLDKVLAELVSKGEISIDEALIWALDPKALKMMIY